MRTDPIIQRPQERRFEYRLHYPKHLRPRMQVGADILDIYDISEFGLRFAAGKRGAVTCGNTLAATVNFRQAPPQTVVGNIVRVNSQETAMRLAEGLDFRTIANEHDMIATEPS